MSNKSICVKCNLYLRPDGLCVICDQAGPEPCEEMLIDNEVKDHKAEIDALVGEVVGKVDINRPHPERSAHPWSTWAQLLGILGMLEAYRLEHPKVSASLVNTGMDGDLAYINSLTLQRIIDAKKKKEN